MRRSFKYSLFLVLTFTLLTLFICCKTKAVLGLNDFEKEMKAKNFDLKLQDSEQYFLPTSTKLMKINSDTLTIYVFKSSKTMEKEAKFISKDGFSYNNDSRGVNADWISSPHFFKKGKLIVQYIGKNKKIISSLKSVLGNQFAGKK